MTMESLHATPRPRRRERICATAKQRTVTDFLFCVSFVFRTICLHYSGRESCCSAANKF